jgi:chromosomal replication initiation ATPase DnaA
MKNPEDAHHYRWSSQPAYLGKQGPVTVETGLVLRQLGNTAAQASKAYREFMKDGRNQGHEERYYQAVDQRFLGDEKFIEQFAVRAPKREIRASTRKISFEQLLHAVAQVHDCKAKDLTAPGRRRDWAKPRAQLAYLAREWCAMKAVEIADHLHRDSSMVSRLCAIYEVNPDPRTEKALAAAFGK